jgi:hypothetical protein
MRALRQVTLLARIGLLMGLGVVFASCGKPKELPPLLDAPARMDFQTARYLEGLEHEHLLIRYKLSMRDTAEEERAALEKDLAGVEIEIRRVRELEPGRPLGDFPPYRTREERVPRLESRP